MRIEELHQPGLTWVQALSIGLGPIDRAGTMNPNNPIENASMSEK